MMNQGMKHIGWCCVNININGLYEYCTLWMILVTTRFWAAQNISSVIQIRQMYDDMVQSRILLKNPCSRKKNGSPYEKLIKLKIIITSTCSTVSSIFMPFRQKVLLLHTMVIYPQYFTQTFNSHVLRCKRARVHKPQRPHPYDMTKHSLL